MSAAYRCPGVAKDSPGGRARITHLDGCCAQFALMSPERQAAHGRPVAGAVTRPAAPRPPAPMVISAEQAAAVVAELQRRATQNPGVALEPTYLWVEYGPEHSDEQIQALYDLGRPYGLVLACRRVPRTGQEQRDE